MHAQVRFYIVCLALAWPTVGLAQNGQQEPSVLLPMSVAMKLLRAAHRAVDDAQAQLDRETAVYNELYAEVQRTAREVPESPPLPPHAGATAPGAASGNTITPKPGQFVAPKPDGK
jgi:hypothetical protein